MDEASNEKDFFVSRIQQLERERDELHKDIEQLCMQQAGPSYLAAATRLHFQRTAGLEQEIENLKKKLVASTRENLNLQEELEEAYRIKSQLADLHRTEVAKSMEAEKQAKFFQSCVAAAFAERDHSIMEAEKAKEKEEVLSNKLNDIQKRVEELSSDYFEEKKLTAALKIELEKKEKQDGIFKKVINKFYEIRQPSPKSSEDTGWESKCECLLHDSAEMWTFHDPEETSASKYISALEDEVQGLRKSMDNLQNKLQMGLEIENHLKKKICNLEEEKIRLEEKITKGLSRLYQWHSQQRVHVMDLLDEGYSHIKSIISIVEEKIGQLDMSKKQYLELIEADIRLRENECQDMCNSIDAGSYLNTKRDAPVLPHTMAVEIGDASEALAQALQEKVAALLLLSQQEERHLLERNVNAALQKKMEELQRNLLQVTNEKVKALLELARLKQDYQQLQEKVGQEIEQGVLSSENGEKRTAQERDGKLKNLLKKTYLKPWIGPLDTCENEAEGHTNNEWNISSRKSNYGMNFARMKIEYATLKESLESMEHLTSSVHRLRLLLLKVMESFTSESAVASLLVMVDSVVTEAQLLKTALGSSLSVSWSGEADGRSFGEYFDTETESEKEKKADVVPAAGFEMVELLLLAARILKDNMNHSGCRDVTET